MTHGAEQIGPAENLTSFRADHLLPVWRLAAGFRALDAFVAKFGRFSDGQDGTAAASAPNPDCRRLPRHRIPIALVGNCP